MRASVVAEADAGWTTYPTSDTGTPGESKQKEVRYLDIHEDDPLDEVQLAAWVKQASQLPTTYSPKNPRKDSSPWMPID
ncbi:MAG: hypothetical protein AABP62_23710 [Planctomycetota bacterium]